MLDIVKKTILAGRGATVTTTEMVEAALNEFVEKGKITADEAREMGEKIVRESKKEFEESKEILEKQLDVVLSKAKWVTQNQWVALEERVRKIEDKIDGNNTAHKSNKSSKINKERH